MVDRLRRVGIAVGLGESVDWTANRLALRKVEVGTAIVTIHLNPGAIPNANSATGLDTRLAAGDRVVADEACIRITIPATFTRRSGALVALNPAGGDAVARVRHDRTLTTALIRAEAWKRRLLFGKAASVEDLAREEGITASYVTRVMRVAFLAPDLKRAILDGAQPGGLTLQRVLTHDMPLVWERRRAEYRS